MRFKKADIQFMVGPDFTAENKESKQFINRIKSHPKFKDYIDN
jgi:hypothetical protein